MREVEYKYFPTLHLARKEMSLNLPFSAWNAVLFRMFEKKRRELGFSYVHMSYGLSSLQEVI